MAVSYGSSGVRSNKAAVATTDTVTPALPAGVAAGDQLVIFASSFRDATTFSADQSYVNTRQNTKIAILEKTAGGSEVAPTVTFGGLTVGDLISAVIMRFPGGAATKDWSNVTGAMSATTLPGPPLTVADTGSVGVVIGYQPNDKTGATFTANSWTEREYTFTTTGTDGTHYVATQDGLVSGAQTMPTWTWVGGLEYRAISFSVPPGTGNQTITGALFSNSNTFFGATVSAGAVSITGSLYSDADAFYGATVAAIWPISGSLYQDTDAFYGAVASANYSISGSQYSEPDAFYSAIVVADSASHSITSSGTSYSHKTLSRVAREAKQAGSKRKAVLVKGIAGVIGNPPQANRAVQQAISERPAEFVINAPELADLAIRASEILALWDEEEAELLLLTAV